MLLEQHSCLRFKPTFYELQITFLRNCYFDNLTINSTIPVFSSFIEHVLLKTWILDFEGPELGYIVYG